MKFCSKCGKELVDDAVVCTSCGCSVTPQATSSAANDQVSVGLCIVSALIPLVGLIYWPLKHKETPKKAAACGITGLVAWIIYIIIAVGGMM